MPPAISPTPTGEPGLHDLPTCPGVQPAFFLTFYFAILHWNAVVQSVHRLPLAHLPSCPHTGDKIYWPRCFWSPQIMSMDHVYGHPRSCLWRAPPQAFPATAETAGRVCLAFLSRLLNFLLTQRSEKTHTTHLKKLKPRSQAGLYNKGLVVGGGEGSRRTPTAQRTSSGREKMERGGSAGVG